MDLLKIKWRTAILAYLKDPSRLQRLKQVSVPIIFLFKEWFITYLFEITPNVNREVLKVLAKNSAKNFYKNKGKN